MCSLLVAQYSARAPAGLPCTRYAHITHISVTEREERESERGEGREQGKREKREKERDVTSRVCDIGRVTNWVKREIGHLTREPRSTCVPCVENDAARRHDAILSRLRNAIIVVDAATVGTRLNGKRRGAFLSLCSDLERASQQDATSANRRAFTSKLLKKLLRHKIKRKRTRPIRANAGWKRGNQSGQ